MATASYTHLYEVTGGSVGGLVTVTDQGAIGLASIYDQDGNTTDNQTTVGSAPGSIDLDIFGFGAPNNVNGGQVIGVTAAGEPIVTYVAVAPPNPILILSNNPNLDSGPVSTASSGTYTYCFGAGTGIDTPKGQTAVERLKIGQLIRTANGRAVPVKWIGQQTVSTRFGPAERLMPVRVRAGALGNGLPVRDLVLTADHALLIDGLLINAGALVNGASIDFVPLAELGDSYTVYHIETENHDVILAEGAPAETYIDYVARRAFGNYAEYLALYGEERTIPEAAYPRISSARMVPSAIRLRLGRKEAA